MIRIKLNEENFQYDIHSLVKAFYPEQDVKFCGMEVSEASDADACLEVWYAPSGIELIWREDGTESRRTFCDTQDADRTETKNRLKRAIYGLLSESTGRVLPWGDLTGIRPTRIPMSLLEQGRSQEEIAAHMMETYLVSEEKTRLSIEIAQRERELLSPIHYAKGYSLYIGIPFCPTTCLYCSFTSYPIAKWQKRVGDYLTALEREMDFTADRCRNLCLDTVYIGGGTPTTLEPEALDRLLCAVEEKFDLRHLKEFTVESGRPDSITPEKLAVLKKHHVTRISINPQTMKEETLRVIGRCHTVAQTLEAYRMARDAGFDNINMDLIMGLPGETSEDVRHTLSIIEELRPDSLTVHSLAVKRASKLAQWMEENGRDALCNTPEMMMLTENSARRTGLFPYYLYRQKNMAGNFENVGYARPGKEGIYNILIMEEKQTIMALGAGTITKRVYDDGRIERCDNVKDVALYIEKIDEMIERKRKLFSDF